MKELYILRHADAVKGGSEIADFDRQLSKVGIAEARFIGKKCKDSFLVPDVIYSSSARRALTTAIILAEEINFVQDKMVILPQLYDIYPDQMMEIILATSDEHSKVMLVGHNPVLSVFLNLFTLEGVYHLPTGTLVKITYSNIDNWKGIKDVKGTIESIWKPLG